MTLDDASSPTAVPLKSKREGGSDISRRHAWFAILLITILGAALRIYRLGFHGLWYDEAFTAWAVAQTPKDIVWISLQDIVHPPLYYLLLSSWTWLVGDSEFALRTLSAGASLLGVPLLYQLGRRGWSRRVGLAAALLWACAPFAVWYAQEARMYALLTTVGMAALLCLARALPGGRRRPLAANAVLNLVGLYTHYFYLFFLLSQYLYLALTLGRHRRAFWRWFWMNGIAAALYLPWLAAILLGDFYRAQIAWIEPLSPQTMWTAFWELNTAKDQPLHAAGVVTVVLLTGGVVAAAVGKRGKRRGPVPGLTWMHLLLTVLLVTLISFQQPLFHSRFLQIVLPAYLLLAAVGLMRSFRIPVGALLVLLVVLANVPTLFQMYTVYPRPHRGWREAMDYMASRAEPEDTVTFRGGQGYHAYWYYYDGPSLRRISLLPEEELSDLAAQAAGSQKAWLVMWDPLLTCEPPDQFVPEATDPLETSDMQCFPAVIIASYTWREPGNTP